MKIAVYDCVAGDALTEKYGSVGNSVIQWIKPHLPEATWIETHIANGAKMPDPSDVDGIIISGSEKGVYDDTPWMQPLRDNLETMRNHGIPIFGICFGHQIMADVFGGKAEKVDQGFITGARSFDMGGHKIPAHVAHQDQVTRLPPGASVTASAPYCPAAALAYDFPAMSVQFHPEYSPDFTLDLIDMFGAELMTDDQIAAARQSVTGDVPTDLYGQQVAEFFRNANAP